MEKKKKKPGISLEIIEQGNFSHWFRTKDNGVFPIPNEKKKMVLSFPTGKNRASVPITRLVTSYLQKQCSLFRNIHWNLFIFCCKTEMVKKSKNPCNIHRASACLPLMPPSSWKPALIKTSLFLLSGRGIGRRVSLINQFFLEINIFADSMELLRCPGLAAREMEADLPVHAERAAIAGAARATPPRQLHAQTSLGNSNT